jgi:glycosyltransferase involved in cell wall biosynthesis
MSGAERFVKEITERLSARYRFVIVSAKLDKNLPDKEIKNGIEIHRVGFGNKFDKWIYPVFAPFAVLKYKPVLLHAVMESYAGIALWISSFLTKVPRILTLQSGDLDDASKQNKIPHWLWKKIHTTPNKITAISNFLKNRALNLGAPEEKISVIPNGVDFSEINKLKEIEKIPRRIICVGRLSWEKGHEYLFSAMQKILMEFPDARLVLVGAGPKENELKELANSLRISHVIDFLGNLSHNRALEEIKKSSVFICPSLAEGLGIVFIEAQACGIPVIGTKIGGIPDVIQDGVNGLLISSRDSEAIYNAIKGIWNNPSLASEYVQNALQSVKKFDWDKIAENISAIYETTEP